LPRKTIGDKLERVASTNISTQDFEFLEYCARSFYNRKLIEQPTISHMLRWLIKGFIRRKKEKMQEESDKRKTVEWLQVVYFGGTNIIFPKNLNYFKYYMTVFSRKFTSLRFSIHIWCWTLIVGSFNLSSLVKLNIGIEDKNIHA